MSLIISPASSFSTFSLRPPLPQGSLHLSSAGLVCDFVSGMVSQANVVKDAEEYNELKIELENDIQAPKSASELS
jgi:hypothetical protein